jgi:hypothetical protein
MLRTDRGGEAGVMPKVRPSWGGTGTQETGAWLVSKVLGELLTVQAVAGPSIR